MSAPSRRRAPPPARPPGARPLGPWRLLLATAIALVAAGAVAFSVLLNLPIQPPSGLTSPSGTAAAPDIVQAAQGTLHSLVPSTGLPGQPAVTSDFLTGSVGWAVVGCGPTKAPDGVRPCQVIGTTDGGLTWTTLWQTSQQLAGVAFANRRDGYAWTGSGACEAAACPTRLFATTDGGRMWVQQFVGATVWSSVAVTGPATLWATVGGLLDVSRDGGRGWRIVPTPGCIAQSVRFAGQAAVVAGTSGEGACALQSADGGAHWKPLLTGLDAHSVAPAYARFIADSGLSSALGGPARVRTACAATGGWPAGPDAAWLVVRCDSLNPDMLAVLYTPDAGGHWRLVWDTAGCTGACVTSGAGEDPLAFLGNVAWRSAPGAVAVAGAPGMPFRAGGRLCHAAACTPSVELLSPQHAVAATGQGLFTTVDGGKSWQRLWPDTGPGPLVAASVVAPDALFALASLHPGSVLESRDGGATWLPWAVLPGGLEASLLDFVTGKAGYVYGTQDGVPVLFYTGDGGARFRLVALPTSEGRPLALAQLAFRTATTGLAIDVYGDAWLTTDGGATWHLLAALPLGLPQSAVWTGPKSLFAVVALKQTRKTPAGQTTTGHLGLVASYDGGAAFTPLAAWPWPSAQSFHSTTLAARGQSIWLFAYAGLLASADGGATWIEIRLPVRYLHPVSLAFTDARHGWLLTTSGALFVTADGGHTWRQVTQGR